MAKLTEEQRAQYILEGGVSCPFCRESDLHCGEVTVDGGYCFQNATCAECGATWTDEYTLTGITYEEPTYLAEDMARAIWADTLAQSEGR
jgi:transposase-like protein